MCLAVLAILVTLLLSSSVISRDIELFDGETPNEGARHACKYLSLNSCCSLDGTTFKQVTFRNFKLGDNLEVWGKRGSHGPCRGNLLRLILVSKVDGAPISWSGEGISGALILARDPDPDPPPKLEKKRKPVYLTKEEIEALPKQKKRSQRQIREMFKRN